MNHAGFGCFTVLGSQPPATELRPPSPSQDSCLNHAAPAQHSSHSNPVALGLFPPTLAFVLTQTRWCLPLTPGVFGVLAKLPVGALQLIGLRLELHVLPLEAGGVQYPAIVQHPVRRGGVDPPEHEDLSETPRNEKPTASKPGGGPG